MVPKSNQETSKPNDFTPKTFIPRQRLPERRLVPRCLPLGTARGPIVPVVDVLPGLGDGGEAHVAEPLPRLGEALLEVGVARDLLEDGLSRLGQVPLALRRVVPARLARSEGRNGK